MQAYHPRADPLRHHRAGQHLTAGVPHPHQIAIGNPPRPGILRMNSQRFASGNGIAFAQRGVVQLTVQPVGRMRRQQLQLPRLGVAMPLVGLQPHWVRRQSV